MIAGVVHRVLGVVLGMAFIGCATIVVGWIILSVLALTRRRFW